MTSYDDLISDATGMMYMNKYDFNKDKNGDSLAAFKLWNMNFKAAPKAGVSVAHNWTKQQTWNVAKYDEAVKNSTKVGFKHDDLKFNVAATNDKYTVSVESPIVKDDWKVDAGVTYESKPMNSGKLTGQASIESPDMSGAVAAINLKVDQEWKMAKNEWKQENPKIAMDACVNVEKDYFVGGAIEHDTKEMTGSEVMLMKSDDKNKYWVGHNIKDEFAQAGCLIHNAEKKFSHAYELRYHTNTAKESKKVMFMEQPLSLVAGGKYSLSDKTTMNYMVELNAAPTAQCKFTHKVDKNWTVAMHQAFNVADVEKKHPHQLGFDVNYAL